MANDSLFDWLDRMSEDDRRHHVERELIDVTTFGDTQQRWIAGRLLEPDHWTLTSAITTADSSGVILGSPAHPQPRAKQLELPIGGRAVVLPGEDPS